jgi:hypothetical protein
VVKLAPSLAFFALALAAGLAPASRAPGGALAVGQLRFTESVWRPGSIPSVTVSVLRGRGIPERVSLFLYVSDEPNAFATSDRAPQFVGDFTVPFNAKAVVDLGLRHRGGRITEGTPEKFVQGVLVDARTGTTNTVTNEAYLDIAYPAAPTVFTLDFSTQDDFATPLVNGQDLSTPPEFGRLVSLSSRQPAVGDAHQGLAIFDSTRDGPNAKSSDRDLLVGLGNVVILQENPGQSVPGIFTFPDDAANGGTIVVDFDGFDFIEKVEPRALDLIDVDALGSVQVRLTDVLGNTRTFSVPSGWTGDRTVNGPPGYRTLDLTTLAPQPGLASTATASGDPGFVPGEVVRLEATLTGSGALDNLVFAREADPGTAEPATGGGKHRAR